jgi:hypothetical protein
MAIEFNCPHCQHPYRLKDELAGKTATCKNTNCRQKIVIPQPKPVPDDTPLPLTAAEIAAQEAAAMAALADEPVQTEQEAAKKIIDVECPHCSTKWTEPIERAGKNTLCKNPECKARIKIPEPKDEGQYDWRHKKSKLPEGARQNQPEKPEGVVDAAAGQVVSGKALKEAEATGEEYEPIPLKRKAMFALLALGLVASVAFGVFYLVRSRTEGKEDKLMTEAQTEFTQVQEALPKDEIPLFTAVLHMAVGEHALRHDTKDKLKDAREQLAKAREALRPGNSPARNALCAELAVAYLALGGTEQEIRDQTRLRWVPDANMRTRPNEKVITVFEELQLVLGLVAAADLEFRTYLARRLTRELAKRGQSALALDMIPLALFTQQEQAEAKAVVALELHRAKESDLARRAAEELKNRGAELTKGTPQPASALTLFLILGVDKPPTIAPPPPAPGNVILDATRYAYTGLYTLEGNNTEQALAIARRDGRPEQQVRALTLCADWATDPGSALDTAFGIISANKSKKDVTISPYLILRLTQIAAATGKHEQAKQLADLLPDDSARGWARGDAVRIRLAGAPKEKADEAWAELPDDAKKYRAGHAWARMGVARQNTRVSGDRSAEVKAVVAWPSPLVPFGKAGVALGLQDKDRDK